MNREAELRAKLRWQVQQEQKRMIECVSRAICMLHETWPRVTEEAQLSGSRISNLRFAAHAYANRRTAQARLNNLEAELTRMKKRSGEQPAQQAFYTELRALLGLDPQKQPPWIQDITGKLRLTTGEQEHWPNEIRLACALAVLKTLATIYETQPLQQQLDTALESQEGFWRCH